MAETVIDGWVICYKSWVMLASSLRHLEIFIAYEPLTIALLLFRSCRIAAEFLSVAS